VIQYSVSAIDGSLGSAVWSAEGAVGSLEIGTWLEFGAAVGEVAVVLLSLFFPHETAKESTTTASKHFRDVFIFNIHNARKSVE
jgi:hypothetical protein